MILFNLKNCECCIRKEIQALSEKDFLRCPVNAEKTLWKNISLGLKSIKCLTKTPVSKFKVFFHGWWNELRGHLQFNIKYVEKQSSKLW